jgi:hypothetical protein
LPTIFPFWKTVRPGVMLVRLMRPRKRASIVEPVAIPRLAEEIRHLHSNHLMGSKSTMSASDTGQEGAFLG